MTTPEPGPAAVLIIEDDESQRCTLEDLLSDEGYRPVACGSVQEGLTLLGEEDFAAAIVDQRLPDRTGVDFLQSLHERERSPRVIINTGYGSFESAKRSVNLGAFAYVEKAGDPGELMRHVHRAAHLHMSEALSTSQARLAAFIEHAPLAIDLKDAGGRYLLANKRHQAFHCGDGGTVSGKRTADLYSPALAQRVDTHDAEVLREGTAVAHEYELSRDGVEATLLVTKFPVRDADGRVRAVGSVGLDITERRRAQVALARSEERYQGLFDQAPDMYFTVGRDGHVLAVNAFGAEYLGYEKADLVGASLLDVIHPDDRDSVEAQIGATFAGGEQSSELEFRAIRRDETTLWVHERVRLFEDDDGDAELRIVCRDVTEARTLSEELSYQATHDALTGLVNRRELEGRLGRVLATCRVDGSEHALCYLDLDQFKVINDTCGHVAGDELLRQLGELLPRRVRKRDTLARLGGDEFAVLMEHCTLMQARRVANTLREAVEEFRFMWQGKTFSVGVSIGLVPIGADSDGASGVLRAADTACYVAKDQGRNRIHVYHEGDLELSRRHGEMEWVTRLNTALREEGFELWCQPIVPLHAPEPGGRRRFELLLRLLDDDGEAILPGAFLPAAERYNVAVRVDRWVVNSALGWLAENRARLPTPVVFSVNLSGQSIADDGFLEFVTGTFDRTGVPPAMICFEITETAAISNLASANRFISTLHDAGCRFALDDFGSGLSSFAYLKHLPVDYLKIDGVFVKDILEDAIDLAMVRSIYDVARAMSKETIAEFVDDERVLEKLREIGVDFAQGYAVGRPAPLAVLLSEPATGEI